MKQDLKIIKEHGIRWGALIPTDGEIVLCDHFPHFFLPVSPSLLLCGYAAGAPVDYALEGKGEYAQHLNPVLAASASRFVCSVARSLELREGLAKADPHSAQAQRDLSVSLDRLGDVEVAAGNLQAARLLFARSSDIREGLAKADPHSALAQRDLSLLRAARLSSGLRVAWLRGLKRELRRGAGYSEARGG